MSNRVFPARRGSQAPSPLGAGAGGGHSSTQGDSGWRSASTHGCPWPSYRLLSQLPHPAWTKKKKGSNHPGNSIWSRNLQGPWVPGSQHRRGWRAGNAKGRCPGRGISRGRRRNRCSRASQPRWAPVAGQPGNPVLEGHHAQVQTQAPGKMLRRKKMQAQGQALGSRGGLSGKRCPEDKAL